MDERRIRTLFPSHGRLSRRTALRRIGGSSAVLAGALGLTRAVPALEHALDSHSLHDDAPFQVREFDLTASEFDWPLMPDSVVRAWGYNGQIPGPELRVREGDLVRVRLTNELPVPTTIHWHGVNVPNAMDGVAGLNQAPVESGATFVYEFTARPAGTRWYHSHTDPALQVPIGLYGPLIIEPRSAQEPVDRDYTYILAEWDAELTPAVAAGTARRGPGDQMLRGGELGSDYFLMNGRMHGSVPPMVVRSGERVLIRLINAGNQPHAFHTHGHSFTIVATDGNSVPVVARWTKDSLLIGPSERYDLLLTADNPGVWMVHCHMEHHMANGMMTLLAYEGYEPTGPIAAVYDLTATPSIANDTGAMPPGMEMTSPEVVAGTPAPEARDTAHAGSSVDVSMVDDRLVPAALTVAAGTTVAWVNNGQDWHSIAALDGSFGSDRVSPGEAFTHRFDQPGTYQYICKHHVLQGMTGTVTVTS